MTKRFIASTMLACCAAILAQTALGRNSNDGELLRIFICANPSSGAVWRVTVDDAHRRVDSFPANISSRRAVWTDSSRGGAYRLDFLTGVLTVSRASSTGGWILQDRCRPQR